MAGLIAKNRLLLAQARNWSALSARSYGGGHSDSHLTLPQQKVDIGAREIVGHGANGEVTYFDSVMSPFPAIVGVVLVCVSMGVWGYLWMKNVVYGPLPDTITNEEKQKAQIDRQIALRMQPIEGLASKYDYEQGKWK